MRSILLMLLVGCVDGEALQPDAGPDVSMPDAPSFEPYCNVSITEPDPMGPLAVFGLCQSTVTVGVFCDAAMSAAQAHNRVLFGWVRNDLMGGGVVEETYRCGQTLKAMFTVPCTALIGGGSFQHPIQGGDLYASEGVVCSTQS